MLCIAKAYGSEPLRRVVTGTAHRLVYVLNPESEDAKNSNSEAGVGFPVDAVFRFDTELFPRLRQAFDSGDQATLWALWQTAQPLTFEMEEA